MKNVKDSLGDRMKKYEAVSKTRLVSRMPVIIRLDGKAFHTFTRGFQKPFDEVMVKSMQETMKYLCENIQGCVLGYTQSDEITLVLVDYAKLESDSWFDNEIQKICSVSASMATMKFNQCFKINTEEWWLHNSCQPNMLVGEYVKICKQYEVYERAINKGAMFDARCFNVPKEDVTNCVLWRQQDATRNSIQSLGQAHFSQKELHCKSCNNIQDMLHEQKGINWNDLSTTLKRGSCCIKVGETMLNEKTGVFETTMHWFIDNEIPIFKGEGRNYIESLINFD